MMSSWCVEIDKLLYWRANNWLKCGINLSKPLLLRVHYDQLMIIADTKVLESMNMTCKMKGVYKEDVLILIVCGEGQEIRKMKFRIVSDPKQTFKRLGEHFPIINHNCTQKKKVMKPKFTKIEEVLKHALNNKDISSSLSMSSVHQNFVKMCLLDPKFHQTVLETKNILDAIKKNENIFDNNVGTKDK